MSSVRIEKYSPKYEKDVEQVFLWAGSKRTRETDGLRELMHAAFCDYYLQKESESCFIAINDEDKAVGYILCAKQYNPEKVKEYVQEKNMDHLEDVIQPSMSFYKEYPDYPAHLHINVLPEYQWDGIGTELMNTLIQYLKDEGIKGLMLGVALNNEKGNNFYAKHHFQILDSNEQANIMGLKL